MSRIIVFPRFVSTINSPRRHYAVPLRTQPFILSEVDYKRLVGHRRWVKLTRQHVCSPHLNVNEEN